MPLKTANLLPEDEQIHALATQVTSAADADIPALLLRIQDLLDRFARGSTELSQCKTRLWSYNIPQLIPAVLKRDFGHLSLGWAGAASLAAILAHVSVGFEPTERQQFADNFLPRAADSLLSVACAVQVKYAKTSDVLEDAKGKLLRHFKSLLDSLSYLFTSHTPLTNHVMRSPWLLQMLMCENDQAATCVLMTVQSANRLVSGLMGSMEEGVVVQLLDEIIYKLSTSRDESLASAATRTVLQMCESNPSTVHLLCSRYRGLRLLLGRWVGTGLSRDIRHLQLLLEAGSVKRAEKTKFHRSASLIQALWRSYKTRTSLKRAHVAIAGFQNTYRIRKADRDSARLARQEALELRHMLLLSRRRLMRQLREKRLASIALLPAADVSRFLENERTHAALKVQALWRGHRVRRSLAGRRQVVRRARAAVKIQRTVRRWLGKLNARQREPPVWQRPPGLTDERRVALQADILAWRGKHEVRASSRDHQVELHERVQELLRCDATKSRLRRKQEQHVAAMIGQLEMDSSLIIESPHLSEVCAPDLAVYVSHAAPVAAVARRNHANELRLLRQPWWRKLGDEYQDERATECELDWRIL